MGRALLTAVAIVLAGRLTAAEDHARPRDSSGSSDHSANVGSQHHSSASSSSESNGGSESGSTSGSATSSSPTPAQQRHPRAGTGTGSWPYSYAHHGSSGGYYPYDGADYGAYYAGYGYYPYVYFGYPAYYYSGYYGYDPYYYAQPYGYRDVASVRVMVEPVKARVYVDGYYAGIADDFDGMFQRLHLSPGRHDITLKLEGYRSHRFRVYVPVEQTLKLRYDMVRGSGEDPEEVVGEPELAGRPAGYARLEDEGREEPARAEEDRRAPGYGEGVLRLDVRPSDASIYVDGAFRGTARELEHMPLRPGRHHIEMVRPGYRTVERDVEVRPGETSEVRADLDRP